MSLARAISAHREAGAGRISPCNSTAMRFGAAGSINSGGNAMIRDEGGTSLGGVAAPKPFLGVSSLVELAGPLRPALFVARLRAA